MRSHKIHCESKEDNILMYRLLLQLGEKVYNDNAVHSPFNSYPSITWSGGVWCGYKERKGISVEKFIDEVCNSRNQRGR